MAAKDAEHHGAAHAREKIVAEMADLWFHGMVALAHYGLSPADVVAELARREGLSGIEEKALRKARERERSESTQGGPTHEQQRHHRRRAQVRRRPTACAPGAGSATSCT
jgi:phosphoribosyl-ATP pyrophosphohydrolase